MTNLRSLYVKWYFHIVKIPNSPCPVKYIFRELRVISFSFSLSLFFFLCLPLQLADIAVTEVVRFPVCKEWSHISNNSKFQSGSLSTHPFRSDNSRAAYRNDCRRTDVHSSALHRSAERDHSRLKPCRRCQRSRRSAGRSHKSPRPQRSPAIAVKFYTQCPQKSCYVELLYVCTGVIYSKILFTTSIPIYCLILYIVYGFIFRLTNRCLTMCRDVKLLRGDERETSE